MRVHSNYRLGFLTVAVVAVSVSCARLASPADVPSPTGIPDVGRSGPSAAVATSITTPASTLDPGAPPLGTLAWARVTDQQFDHALDDVAGDTDGSVWTLTSGTLAGPAREVVIAPSSITTSGSPIDGHLLAWWSTTDATDAGSTVILVDAASGEFETLLLSEDWVLGAALSPKADEWFWTTGNGEAATGLWRAPVEGGEAVLLRAGWGTTAGRLVAADDGDHVAIWGPGAFVYSVASEQIVDVSESDVGDIIGFLGDKVIGYTTVGGLRGYDVVAVDPDKMNQQTIASGKQIWAGIASSTEGPRLVWSQISQDDALQIWTTSNGASKLLYSDPTPLFEQFPPANLVTSHPPSGGVEVTDWIPVFRVGAPFLTEREAEIWPDAPNVLVRLSDGAIVEVPTIIGGG